jgi:signal peptidase I
MHVGWGNYTQSFAEVNALNEEFDVEQKTGFSAVREVYDWVESTLTALLAVALIFTLVGMVISVNGESMLPTLENNERLVTVRMFREPAYGDIVVITNPAYQNNPLIKRIIATEGQTIDFDTETSRVIVDGNALEESYIAEQMDMYFTEYTDMYPYTVPEGHVFAMGDNRNNSWDSRVEEVGAVDERYILGRVIFRLMPLNKIGKP